MHTTPTSITKTKFKPREERVLIVGARDALPFVLRAGYKTIVFDDVDDVFRRELEFEAAVIDAPGFRRRSSR